MQLVKPSQRAYVLNLAEALHPRCIADHLSYVPAIEAAVGAPHWQPPKALNEKSLSQASLK